MWKGNAKAGEKLRWLFQIAQFPFAGQKKLPTPIETNHEQEDRLSDGSAWRQPVH
jgi:hypothetical protein